MQLEKMDIGVEPHHSAWPITFRPALTPTPYQDMFVQ